MEEKPRNVKYPSMTEIGDVFKKLNRGRVPEEPLEPLDYDPVLVDKIIEALGTRVKFDDDAKWRFADSLAESLSINLAVSEDAATFKTHLKALRKAARGAVDKVRSLQQASLDARSALQSITPLAEPGLNQLCDGLYLKCMVEKLDGYQQALAAIEVPSRLRPRRNGAGFYFAQEIAQKYHKYFGKNPSLGKDEVVHDDNPKTTPFDRVCDVVGRYYGVKITHHMRKRAYDDLKK